MAVACSQKPWSGHPCRCCSVCMAIVVFVVACQSSSASSHREVALQNRIASLQSEASRLVTELEERNSEARELRAQVARLEQALDEKAHLHEISVKKFEHAEAERIRSVTHGDACCREVPRLQGELRAVSQRQEATAHSLTKCETDLAIGEQQLRELQRANDILESQLASAREEERTLDQQRKAHEQELAHWADISRQHREQIVAFHQDAGEYEFPAADEEADPHPSLGTPRYFANLKAQEEAYRMESLRRKEIRERHELTESMMIQHHEMEAVARSLERHDDEAHTTQDEHLEALSAE